MRREIIRSFGRKGRAALSGADGINTQPASPGLVAEPYDGRGS